MKNSSKLSFRTVINFILYGVAFTLLSFVYHSLWGNPYDQTIPRASADTPPDPWIYYSSDGGGSCDGNNDPGGSPGCSDAV
jgi:hypothetical protein